MQRPDTHGYSVSKGIPRLRRAICHWYKRRWGVEFDPDTEAIVTIGSKEGIAHLALATLGRGDTVLVPNPSYPIHIYGPVIAGADIRQVPMTPDVDFFAELEHTIQMSFPEAEDADHQFPGEPDGAVRRAAVLREDRRARAASTASTSCTISPTRTSCFDGWKAPSIMQVPGARDVAVEFFTMSKSYNMAGWRIGFMVGNAISSNALVAHQGLPRLRHVHADPGRGHRRARGSAGLRRARSPPKYQKRRDVLVKGLHEAGWTVDVPKASMYVWAKIPEAYRASRARSSSRSSCSRKAKVSVSPGIGFGEYGDGHVRFAMIENESAHAAGDPRHQADVPRGRLA